MNIGITNRLAELRKKSGLSQEELADKLGLSKQSISKWGRAESSPDTDNLVMLAKIYNLSLDELLQTEKPVEDIIKDNKDNINEKDNDSIAKGDCKNTQEEIKVISKRRKIIGLLEGVFFGLAVIIYIFLDYYGRNIVLSQKLITLVGLLDGLFSS